MRKKRGVGFSTGLSTGVDNLVDNLAWGIVGESGGADYPFGALSHLTILFSPLINACNSRPLSLSPASAPPLDLGHYPPGFHSFAWSLDLPGLDPGKLRPWRFLGSDRPGSFRHAGKKRMRPLLPRVGSRVILLLTVSAPALTP